MLVTLSGIVTSNKRRRPRNIRNGSGYRADAGNHAAARRLLDRSVRGDRFVYGQQAVADLPTRFVDL